MVELTASRLRYVLDTNLLVYACQDSEREKRDRALEVIERVGIEPSGAVPAQALAEFCDVALRKLTPPLSPGDAYQQVELYERTFPVVPLTPAIVLEAVRGVDSHALSYYDAQIWAAAKLSQIPIVLSEDFSAHRTIEGVLFLNPFEPEFAVNQL